MNSPSNKPKKKVRLSASSLKALSDCTMAFYYSRVLRLPEKEWPRTIIGSLVHSLFECLRNPRHRKHYDLIVTPGVNVIYQKSPVVARFVRAWQVKHNIDQALLDDLNELLHVGINCTDFFWTQADIDEKTGKPKVFAPEHDFHITLDDGETEVRGFIDDMAVVGGVMAVRDYKSARNKPAVKDIVNNIQALVYQAYIWLTFGLLARVEFVYLRFGPTKRTPDKHLQIVQPASPTTILGFLDHLKSLYPRVDGFTFDDAIKSPHSDPFFCKNVCTHYAPHPYWLICSASDTNGDNPLSSHLSIDKAQKLCKDGEIILERKHEGCAVRWSTN